ncbi:MAG TPA: transcriptional activator domain-containing protein, partial [Herpetosiphonaceae bacterium]
PLALELAAARLASLAPAALLARLTHRLVLLSRGPSHLPERQQTLRATLDWSYRLLDLDAQAALATLAVFAGGWSLAAAAALGRSLQPTGAALDEISLLDLMETLIEHHLIAPQPGPEPRFGMLETVREYALEQLDQRGWAAAAAAAHAAFFRDLALQAAAQFQGADNKLWREALVRDQDNLRLALAWFLAQADGGRGALEMANALQSFWTWHGARHEARQWVEQALAHGQGERTPARVAALLNAGSLAVYMGDQGEAIARFAAGLALCREVSAPREEAMLLINVGRIQGYRGDFPLACALLEDALAISRTLDDRPHLAVTLRNFAGLLCGGLVDLERGLALFAEGLVIARELTAGSYATARLSVYLSDFGYYLALAGRFAEAAVLLAECDALAERSEYTLARVQSLYTLGRLALEQRDYPVACRLLRQSQELIGEMEAPLNQIWNTEGLAVVVAADAPALAARLFASAAAARREHQAELEPIELPAHELILAELRERLGEPAFQSAWGAGLAWPIDQALAAALAAAPAE